MAGILCLSLYPESFHFSLIYFSLIQIFIH